jgi:hypothetical protein
MVEREERGGRSVDGDNALVMNGILGVTIYAGVYTLNVYVMIKEPIEWRNSGS